MGKTYETLERTDKEYQKNLSVISIGSQKVGVTALSRRASIQANTELYQRLKTNFSTRYPDESIKTILFTGTVLGDGTSTTAINFATTLASDFALKVLLVDVNLRTPSTHDIYKFDYPVDLADFFTNTDIDEITSGIREVGPGNLYVLPSGENHSNPVALLGSNRFARFLSTMREEFDHIILDGPPVLASSESRAVCTITDGVVLVLRSGKTRRQVALKAKRELEEAGGKIIGVVLNRRKFYIPNWIYKRF